MKKVLFIDNTAHHLYGQLHLMHALRHSGYLVECCCPDDGNYFSKIKEQGFVVYPITLNIRSRNPLRELKLIFDYYCLFNRCRPDLICSFTIKPNLYGAIAARKCKIKFIANVTGLGYAFMQDNWLRLLVICLYRFSFRSIVAIVFQNNTDRELFLQYNIINSAMIAKVLPGDGVDIDKFYYTGIRNFKQDCKFLFSGRLLWDKGLGDLVAAFKVVKEKYPTSRLTIIGDYFPGNPTAIPATIIEQWQEEKLITYRGMVDDVPQVIQEHDCIVLPSYREGMPRTLLEACSMGKPIISVMTPGCCEVMVNNYNGVVAEVKNIPDIANAMIRFIELTHEERSRMGRNGRKLIEQRFNQLYVIHEFTTLIINLIDS